MRYKATIVKQLIETHYFEADNIDEAGQRLTHLHYHTPEGTEEQVTMRSLEEVG